MKECEPAIINSGPLGQTEKDDIINRANWHACVVQHKAAIACFNALKESGYVEEK